MPDIARTAIDMITGMRPEVRPGAFVFVTLGAENGAGLAAQAIATFREDEGPSLILPVEAARQAALPTDQPMRCITLSVHSALDGVGLTAAVSAALAAENIPCNIVAAFHHDHVFVPAALCDRALQVLTALQDRTAEKK